MRFFILVGLVVGVIAVFAPDEGAGLMRSVVHGFGWGIGHEIAHSVFGHRRSCKCRRLSRRTQRRVKRARPRELNPPELAMAYADYQVAEPRQMCSLPYIADMIAAALEFVGGSASRPANSLAVALLQDTRRQGSMRDGVGARPQS